MEIRRQILTRMYVVLTLLGVVPVLVVGQMIRLSWVEGAELRARGERQASSFVEIPAIRGAVLDHAGRVLAVNTAQYELALDPTSAGFSAKAELFFERLSKLTGQSVALYRRKVRDRASPQYVLLARGLSERQKEAIEQWEVPGVLLAPRFARRYTYGQTASHVLGHTDPDLRGIAGLELQYEPYLSGRSGRRAVKRDMHGRIKALVGGAVTEPVHGEQLVLTIDLIRQTILEEELARGVDESEATWGTAIAIDPYTGAVLAMGNVPTYDPNQAGAFPVPARRNRAITDKMEPGSTFKLVTAVAALEQGQVRPEDSLDTGDGWAVFHGRTLRDTRALGWITFADAIAQSSNVGVAKTAARLKKGVFYQYARNLGFGQPTLIDLPGEVAGSLKKPDAWSGVTQAWMSIGYEVEATPLQVLTAYAALANGGLLVHPYVVAERRDLSGRPIWKAQVDSVRRAFRKETADRLRPVFERVVAEGTATRAQVPGLRIAGKTGTAQKAAGGAYDRSAYRASFVGFFPAERPTVALIVVLDEPRNGAYGGAVAAPIFQRIARRWIGTFPHIAEQMTPRPPRPEAPVQMVPDVTGLPAGIAARRLSAAGFPADVPEGPETAALVTAQGPETGAAEAPGRVVRLVAGAPGQPDRMPDLTGLTAREAAAWLRARNIEVRIRGTGVVVGQEPQAGAPAAASAVLRCQ